MKKVTLSYLIKVSSGVAIIQKFGHDLPAFPRCPLVQIAALVADGVALGLGAVSGTQAQVDGNLPTDCRAFFTCRHAVTLPAPAGPRCAAESLEVLRT